MTGTASPPETTRDFTVAVFVIRDGQVLLQWHRKLARWLPPGGHIEPNELPDDAAVREVREETGQHVRLLGEHGVRVSGSGLPRQLVRPIGIQLEDIGPAHQHIDLIYFAELDPNHSLTPLPEHTDWHGPDTWGALALTGEVTAWCERALDYGAHRP